MSIEFEGYDVLISKIEKLEKAENIKNALKEASLAVEKAAKQKAKKGRTGELRNSITSKVDGFEGVVYTPLEYAPYVEYGTGLFAENGGRSDVPWCYEDEQGEWHSTSGMKPQPFMRPALDESREEIIRILKEGIKFE